MAEASLKLGTDWATKEDYLLGFNDENGNYKPIPFDFSRASIGTRVNRDGLIETVQDNIPRIDFSDGEGSLLLEPQRTNLAPYSEDASNYTTSGTGTVTDNAETSPEGVDNAFELNDTSSGAYFRIEDNITLTATDHTLSVFVKKTSGSLSHYAGLQLDSARKYVILDTTNGTYNEATGTDNDSVTIEDFSDDWWRVIITNNVSAGSKRIALWSAISENGTSIATSATGSNVFYGLQLEAGSYNTSLIPTSGSAVTRVADSCDNGGDSNTFNDSEGVLYAEIEPLVNDASLRSISISDGTANNEIFLQFSNLTSRIECRVIVGGALQSRLLYVFPSSDEFLTMSKFALKYKVNDFSLWINGTEKVVDASGSVPSGNVLDLLKFERSVAGQQFYGNCKELRVYNTALTDTELEELTTI